LLRQTDDLDAQQGFFQISPGAAGGGGAKIPHDGNEQIRPVRPLAQSGRTAPAALAGRPLEDDGVALDMDVAALAFDVDLVRAPVGRPGQMDVPLALGEVEREGCRVLDRRSRAPARLERRGDGAGRAAGPAQDARERVPAVIEQDAAAGDRRIEAPVRAAALGPGGGRGTQRAPAERAHGPDRAFGKERGNPDADRRLRPIVNRVHHAPGGFRRPRDGHGLRRAGHQGFLAEDMKAGAQRALDQRGMAAGRRADVDEIEPLGGQQVFDALMAAPARAGGEEGLAPCRRGVGGGDDGGVAQRLPSGQMRLGGDRSEADEGAAQPHQSSPKRRAMAAKAWSRISTPRRASSSVMIKGGFMRMTCE
jgi:hypothetical protein